MRQEVCATDSRERAENCLPWQWIKGSTDVNNFNFLAQTDRYAS